MRHTRPTKQTHRALFLALQADAKEYPGGLNVIENFQTLCETCNKRKSREDKATISAAGRPI